MRLLADEGVEAPIAQEQRALLLTNDKDFGTLVFQQHKVTSGVILLRLSGLSMTEKTQIVLHAVRDHEDRLGDAFTVITPTRIRIRASHE